MAINGEAEHNKRIRQEMAQKFREVAEQLEANQSDVVGLDVSAQSSVGYGVVEHTITVRRFNGMEEAENGD